MFFKKLFSKNVPLHLMPLLRIVPWWFWHLYRHGLQRKRSFRIFDHCFLWFVILLCRPQAWAQGPVPGLGPGLAKKDERCVVLLGFQAVEQHNPPLPAPFWTLRCGKVSFLANGRPLYPHFPCGLSIIKAKHLQDSREMQNVCGWVRW